MFGGPAREKVRVGSRCWGWGLGLGDHLGWGRRPWESHKKHHFGLLIVGEDHQNLRGRIVEKGILIFGVLESENESIAI
jgi:hypothetical protein